LVDVSCGGVGVESHGPLPSRRGSRSLPPLPRSGRIPWRHAATGPGAAWLTGGTIAPWTGPQTDPGDYPFHCKIHASMTATLTVD
jgi:hypothetical protein